MEKTILNLINKTFTVADPGARAVDLLGQVWMGLRSLGVSLLP